MEATKTYDSLNTAWGGIEPSPADHGSVELIVRRPVGEEREELLSARFAAADGLQGDNWLERGRAKGSDPSPDTQITLMNSRVIQLLAGDKSGWAASGDQLFVDLNITMENLPAGTQLQIGEVTMQISQTPHTGCAKFARRFGAPARKWIMSDIGKQERRRGVYARVVQDGVIKVGDSIKKL